MCTCERSNRGREIGSCAQYDDATFSFWAGRRIIVCVCCSTPTPYTVIGLDDYLRALRNEEEEVKEYGGKPRRRRIQRKENC